MNDEVEASEPTPAAQPPRRSARRIFWGVVLILLGCVLVGTGVDALLDPAAVVASSSDTARSPDTDGEAAFGGLLMCFVGIIVLLYGIGLLATKSSKQKPSKDASPGS